MTFNNHADVAREKVRQEILQTASAMLAGEEDLYGGCRKLCELSQYIGASHRELFFPIIGFDSEADNYPLGVIRQHCSQEYLRRMDPETEKFLQESKPWVLAACKRILDALQAEG